MYFIKGALVIFLLHLIPVAIIGIYVATGYHTDGVKTMAPIAWLVFFVIDMPLIWSMHSWYLLFVPIKSLVSPFSNPCLNYYWDYVIVQGCIIQLIGWMNWCIILMLPLLIGRLWVKSDRACPKHPFSRTETTPYLKNDDGENERQGRAVDDGK